MPLLITSYEFYYSFCMRFPPAQMAECKFVISHGVLLRARNFFPYEGNNRAYRALRKKRCYDDIMAHKKQLPAAYKGDGT